MRTRLTKATVQIETSGQPGDADVHGALAGTPWTASASDAPRRGAEPVATARTQATDEARTACVQPVTTGRRGRLRRPLPDAGSDTVPATSALRPCCTFCELSEYADSAMNSPSVRATVFHDGADKTIMHMKHQGALPAHVESVISTCIVSCLAVHRALGPGFNEGTYARACRIELRHAGLAFDDEKVVRIRYRGELVCTQRIDLFVENAVVLELKSVEAIQSVHVAQVVSYLRAIGARAGLIVNFNVPLLKNGLKRVVL
jgi:GxxExxY protein